MYVCMYVRQLTFFEFEHRGLSDHASVSVTEYHLRQLLKPATAVSVGVTVENVMRSSVRDRWRLSLFLPGKMRDRRRIFIA